ncbi:MAG: hypothetical protein BGO69_06865 [Bacteroidetes bacterium 46-16]|nr:MAG: hypothetical protein BGO69_06865 [Bacteroidetes bacterium 46-16]
MAWACSAHAQSADTLQQGNDSTAALPQNDTTVRHFLKPAEGTGHKLYTVKGIVQDKSTGEGIAFATVFFPGTPVGTAADEDGNFVLEFDKMPESDTLRVESMGYTKFNKRLDPKQHKYELLIDLSLSAASLSEVVVHAGEDPAVALFKKVVRAKPYNNPDHTANYRYEAYNKLEVDIEDFSKKQFRRLPIPMIRKFSFIYNNVDSTSGDKPFLPLYLVETLSDYYFQRKPKKQREFIKASQVKGVENQSITKYLGTAYQSINPYHNFIPVFDRRFVSPVNDEGLFYYKYTIIDTQHRYDHDIIHMSYRPLRPGENCFSGDIWIVDSVYALQAISMDMPKVANVNWVKQMNIYQEFAPVNDQLWFWTKDQYTTEFAPPYNLKLPLAIGRKATSYKNVVADDELTTQVLNDPRYREDVIVSDSARTRSDVYWAANRHDTLNKNERAIYHMVDTLDSMKSFRHFKHLMYFVVTGTYKLGPVELGPYYYLYSSNAIEGQRFRFTMGTTPKLFKDIYLNGYLAYGTLDKRFKYSASGLWLLNRKPRMYLYGSYTSDLDLASNYYVDNNQVSGDNAFSSLSRKPGVPWKLAYRKEGRFEFYKQYFSGFSHELNFVHREFTPYAPLPSAGIFKDEKGEATDHVTSAEVGIKLRYAYKEKFLEGNYYRVSIGSKYPIVNFEYSKGLKNIWNSNYDYDKLKLTISGDLKIPPLGLLTITAFAGKYFGTLPYPLLEVHPGNEYYYYNPYAFEMMNRYEFISDQYAGIMLDHSIGGGIFNYIPGVKRLKLRQFWTAKGIIGSLSDENKALNLNKGFPFRTLGGEPYLELGTGIENILRIFRVDFVWRVTPKPQPGENQASYFGIFGSMKVRF